RIDNAIPDTFHGYPTRFPLPDEAPVRHHVVVTTVHNYFTALLGVDPTGELSPDEWLSLPTQKLREATAGAVFVDPSGELTKARERLRWYPDDVWLYALACQWRRLDQEEPFVGRTGQVGDELGSSIVASRLVRDLMRLCFLME